MNSKPKKTQIKDNNINSKLLGANLNDINVQKFRDLSQIRKDRFDISGKITIPILKTLTNKFSPDVMFTVVLPNQALGNIDALGQCVNLMVLNLSKNSIDNISCLKKLTKIRLLDLSQNSISNIDSLNFLSQLVNLNLQGNLIKGLDQLRVLKNCQNLKNLHLQTISSQKANPICQLNNYRKNVLQQFQQIKRLDCIPSNMEFSNGSELKQNKKKEIKLDIKTIGPFYTNKFPSISPYVPPTYNEQTSLKKSINSCKGSIQDLEVKMRALLATM